VGAEAGEVVGAIGNLEGGLRHDKAREGETKGESVVG
jgi:hypothetical protein